MKALWLNIKNQIVTKFKPTIGTAFNFPDACVLWNQQKHNFEKLQEGSTPLPFIGVEFIEIQEKQLGNGTQLWKLIVRIHIVKEFYAQTDGNGINDDLEIMAFKDAMYKCLQKFEPPGACQFIRVSDKNDSDHDDLVEWVQDYKTNYIDLLMDEPVGGIYFTPKLDYEPEIDVNWDDPGSFETQDSFDESFL